MTKKVRYYVLCLFCLAWMTSCYPDDTIIEPNEPVQPCFMDQDSTITFDTLWSKDLINSSIKFFGKYFIALDNNNNINLYSGTNGELLTQLDPVHFSYFYDIIIINDYVMLKQNNSASQKMHVYSILEKKYTAFDVQLNFAKPKNYYTGDGDHLIMALDNVVCTMDFTGNRIDTLYDISHLPNADFIDNLRTYHSPPSLNRNYLIFTYNDLDKTNPVNNVSYLVIYDLEFGKVFKIFAFSYIHWGSAVFMGVRDHALLYMDQEKVFIFDFVTNRYYSRSQSNLSSTAFPPIHLMPMNYDQNGEFNPILFYNNPNLSAFDLNSGNLKWACESNRGRELSTVKFLRKNGDLETYLLALNEGVDLIDPQTGIVKARFLKKHSKNYSGNMDYMSAVQPDNIFFASDWTKVYKLQIKAQ